MLFGASGKESAARNIQQLHWYSVTFADFFSILSLFMSRSKNVILTTYAPDIRALSDWLFQYET